VKARTAAIGAGLVLLTVAGAAVLLRRGPTRLAVETAPATQQARFVSTVAASGEIVATRYADIGSSVMGKVVALPVKEGDRVKAGQLLASIDAVQAQSDVSSSLEQVRALESDERGAAEAVKAADAERLGAEARARDAEQQLARKRDLHQEALIPASEFESAKAAADSASAQVAGARAAVDRARQSLAAAAGRVAQARALQVRANDVLSKTSVVSPINGIVTRLRVREGEMVVIGLQNQPGTTLMTISDLGAIDAEVKVAEADVLRLEVGQSASVALDALPGKRFSGTVVEVGASALPVTGAGAAAREFKVVVRLEAPDPGLRPGLTCDAEIVTSARTGVLTVPLQSVVLRRDGGAGERTGVFTVAGDTARFVPVTTGVIGGLDIEVNGIDEGTLVISGPYQVLRDLSDGVLVRQASTR
jgi:HlyD family secretion protein